MPLPVILGNIKSQTTEWWSIFNCFSLCLFNNTILIIFFILFFCIVPSTADSYGHNGAGYMTSPPLSHHQHLHPGYAGTGTTSSTLGNPFMIPTSPSAAHHHPHHQQQQQQQSQHQQSPQQQHSLAAAGRVTSSIPTSVIQAATASSSSSYDDLYLLELGYPQRVKKKLKRVKSEGGSSGVPCTGPKRKSREGWYIYFFVFLLLVRSIEQNTRRWYFIIFIAI